MKKHNHIQYTISLFLLTSLFSMGASAAVVDGTHWVIEPGDTLYKIARTMFPGNTLKQTQLRKELISQNPQIFKSGANSISVGDKLLLPSFAAAVKKTNKPTPVKSHATDKTQSIVELAPVKETKSTRTTTRNPKEVIGQVVINVGELSAENRGNRRQLNRRSKILRGDTISTGKQSITQIRLKDGALLSLRPYTNMKIAEYRYNGRQDGTEQSIIELLKGGFRTITGAIGHINKQNYQVRTSVATIGIRGTHYSLVLCDTNCRDDSGKKVDAGLYGGVSDGAVVVKNKTGTHRFNNDEFFQIISERAKPIAFLMPPGILKTSPRDIVKAAKKDKKNKDKISGRADSEHRHFARPLEPNQPRPEKKPELVTDLDPNVTPIKPPSTQLAPDGSAMLIGFNHLNSTGNVSGTAVPIKISSDNNNEITLLNSATTDPAVSAKVPVAVTEFTDDLQGGLIKHEISMVSADGTPATLVPSSLGNDATLGVNWGRWNGEITALEDGAAIPSKNDFHFIYGENVTPRERLSELTGTSVIYTLANGGGTLPTNDQGAVATALPTINMDINFTAQQVTSYDVTANVAGLSYSASASAISFDVLNNGFNIQSVSGCPSGGCTGEASLVFVGANGEGAMNSYVIQDTLGTTAITGTALLK